MKLTKLLMLVLTLALSISLVACDISDLLGDVDDELLEDGTLDDITNGGNENTDEKDNDEEGHECKYVFVSETKSTCTTQGEKLYECSCGKTKTEKLSLLPHTEVIDAATEPTETTPGKTEGKHCSVCGTVIVKQEYIFLSDYSNVEKYDGDYAYNSLLKLSKGEKLTKLYKRIDEAADAFHGGAVDALEDDKYIMATINFSDLEGITADDAIAAWTAFRIDHPLYYWISNNIYYTDAELKIVCDTDYAKSSVRAALNSKIYNGVEKFIEEGYTSSKYNTALAFHDLILLAIDYAYEADGKTPEDDVWAHSIIGVFDKGAGVCESYSKTFQLLLNYCGIENILVSGWANEAHAWNLIKLDDEKWYWCDLTWDDTPEFMWGISYRYFCVNDTQNVGWTDGPFTMAPATFMSAHAPYEKVDTGINYNYDLPARSTDVYTGAEIMLKDTFQVGNLTYAVAGYNCVQLVAVSADGDVNIPATVTYKGKELDVVSIGKLKNGYFYTGSIATYKNGSYTEQYNIGSVTIPESVILIWDDALNFDSLTAITVDKDNEVYASVDGVLYTKDLSVLVKYPTSKAGTELTLPEQTVIIAAGAFTTFYSNTPSLIKLEKIYISSAAVEAGIRDYGYGYYSKKYTETNPWDEIRRAIASGAVIYSKNGSVFNG